MSERAREEWHSKPSEVTHCLFCGVAGRTWMNVGDVPGCSCFEARRVREGKSEFEMPSRRREDGTLYSVITKCSPDLWPALVRAGWLGPMGVVVLTKELSEASVAAMKAAVAAVKAERARREALKDTSSLTTGVYDHKTEIVRGLVEEAKADVERQFSPRARKTSPQPEQTSPQTRPTIETSPQTSPSSTETRPVSAREDKRMRIMAKIIVDPAKSDRMIAAEMGVSRITVAAVRAAMRNA